VIGNLFGPLSHIHELKRIYGPDNTQNWYDIQWHIPVLEFNAGRIKGTCRPDTARGSPIADYWYNVRQYCAVYSVRRQQRVKLVIRVLKYLVKVKYSQLIRKVRYDRRADTHSCIFTRVLCSVSDSIEISDPAEIERSSVVRALWRLYFTVSVLKYTWDK
jgi:hypothetical protein